MPVRRTIRRTVFLQRLLARGRQGGGLLLAGLGRRDLGIEAVAQAFAGGGREIAIEGDGDVFVFADTRFD